MSSTLKYKSTGTEVQKLKILLSKLGHSITGERADYFGRVTETAIKKIQQSANLAATGEVDAATWAYMMSRTAAADYKVSGTIYDAHNAPLANVRVVAYDKDLRTEQQLGTTVSNGQGYYHIEYHSDSFAAAEQASVDLFIKVFKNLPLATHVETLGKSAIHFNVSEEHVLDFKIDNTPIQAVAEFDRLVKKVNILIQNQGVSIAELVENETHQDISFLAGETGEAFDNLALLPIAYNFSLETDIPADIFYGLFRLGFPTTFKELINIKSESLNNGIVTAISENIISSKWRNQITLFLQQFNEMSSKLILSEEEEESIALKNMLSVVLPQNNLHKTFVDTFIALENKPEKFWTVLSEQDGFNEEKVEALKSTFRINHFTLGSKALTTLLLKEQQQDEDLKELRGLAKYTKEDWLGRIGELVATGALTDFPTGIEGETAEEKTENYATVLDTMIKDAYPTAVFNQRLLADTRHPFAETKSDLNTFFYNNQTFDLQSTRIHQLLDNANLTGINDVEALTTELGTINRLYKLSADYKTVSTLRGKGIGSATGLVKTYSKETFVNSFKESIGEDAAENIHNKAKQIDQRATAIMMKLKTQEDIKILAINGQGSTSEIEETARNNASSNSDSFSYQEMFGDNHLCECAHCQSVYSPAAYFTDMLYFMKQNNQAAFDGLIARRADLQHILLTCKNTHTVLPYIDLVNEILENKVAAATTVFQTTLTTAELDAFPEHVNEAAYDKLKIASSSFQLPLNLPLIESRLYLDKLNIKRSDLMRLFYGKKGIAVYTDIAIAAEYLGFSKQELELINGTSHLDLEPAMDLDENGDAISVAQYLQITELTYLELIQLLESYFINPLDAEGNRSITIIDKNPIDEDNPPSCHPDELIFNGIASDTPNKMVRFIRIWKKLGWSIIDLDRVFMAFSITDFSGSPTEINSELLIPLSHIAQIKVDFNLEVAQVLMLFGSFDNRVYYDQQLERQTRIPSLFEQLFLNKQISQPIDTDFENLPSSDNPNLSISDKSALIQAALNISQDDLLFLVELLKKSGYTPYEHEHLSINNLSILYRFVLLARMFRMSIKEVVFALDIFPAFDSMPALLDNIQGLKKQPFNYVELRQLLSTAIDNYLIPTSTDIASLLTALREGLQAIDIQFSEEETQLTPTEIAEKAQKKAEKQEVFIIDTFSNHFDTAPPTTAILLKDLVQSADDNTVAAITPFLASDFIKSSEAILTLTDIEEWAFPNLKDTYLILDKNWQRLSILLSRLNISTVEFVYFYQHQTIFEIDGIWQLPSTDLVIDGWSSYENLVQLLALRNALPVPTDNWLTIFEPIIATTPTAKADFISAIATYLGMAETPFQELLGDSDTNKGILNYDFSNDYLKGQRLLNLLECVQLAQQLGTTPALLNDLSQADITDAHIAKSLLKAKYEAATWLDIIRPISNQVREQKRDALVAYLLTHSDFSTFRENNKIKNANHLFEHFLIDAEMAACMKTSRIKQAISSVQLYIDRCLMNLETGIELNTDFATQWNKWRKVYRVWEANRKVLLYPENWIEPELRDDKSPFFKTLEKKLKQNEVTDEIAEDALREYLEELDKVANLEIIGFFPDEETDIVHVIGRTKNIPHHYYYRKQENRVWTAWEKIDLDIEGDHILPVVWNGRLYLFWGLFEEKQEENEKGIEMPATGEYIESAEKYWEMKLAWSEYKKEKWVSKIVSEEKIPLYVKYKTRNEKNTDGDQIHIKSHDIENISISSNINHSALEIRILSPEILLPSKFQVLFARSLNDVNSTDTGAVTSGGFVVDDDFDDGGKPENNILAIQVHKFEFNNCNTAPKIQKSILVFDDPNESDDSKIFYYESLKKIESTSNKMHLIVKNKTNFEVFKTGLFSTDLNSMQDVELLKKVNGDFRLLPDYHNLLKNQEIKYFSSQNNINLYTHSIIKTVIDLSDVELGNTMGEMLMRKTNSSVTIPFDDVNKNNKKLINTIENSITNTRELTSNSNNSGAFYRFTYKALLK